ncbi:TonB-dependent receptor [Daejeonella sp.]|uniref:SusC/RagA family TonB-linked outer membrane protein n=1 Tax=Daejeonella sp. TaxID=2805397 RepID=UPI0030BD31B5
MKKFSRSYWLLLIVSVAVLLGISEYAFAQQSNTIRGKVQDENGLAMIGVSVRLKGTSLGVSTDTDGRFSLASPEKEGILVFSFIGYMTQEKAVSSQSDYTISMSPDRSSLNEVVVVGYNTLRKKDVSGSVVSVSQDQLKNQTVTGFDQALKGQAAGVQVVQNSGAPGSGVVVRIRGNSSITAGNDPLYVIDGFPITGGSRGAEGLPVSSNPLNSINPADIESIDILKDASATAIYGSRGANGVVIITTKTGKSGKPKLIFDTYTGIQNITKKVDVLSAAEFAEYHIESRNNGWLQSGGNPATPNASRGTFAVPSIYFDPTKWTNTDWQDEIFTTGKVQNYNLALTGGNDNTRYAISASHFNNEGTLIETRLKRYSFKANIDAKLSDKLSMGLRLTPSYSSNNEANSDGHFAGALVGMALRLAPFIGPYMPDGTYTNPLALRNAANLGSLGAVDNPVAAARENQYDLNQSRFLGNMFMDYNITNNLKFKTSIGIDANFNRVHRFLSSQTGRGGTPAPSVPSGNATSGQELEWLNENLLTYNKQINSKHLINALAGFSLQKNDFQLVQVSGSNYPNDNVQYVSAAGLIAGGSENRSQWSLVSYFSRLNYTFDDKYIVTATIRRDGSSRFGSENKYGLFPSGALAWRMSEENFMKKLDFISDFKWRVSYGRSGNNAIGNYTFVPNIQNLTYVLGATPALVNATAPGRLANPFVTWETKRSVNLGADIGFLNNRIELTADVYKSNTNGLLLNVNIPGISGFATSLQNIGEVQNKGLELSVSTANLVNKLKWNTRANISFNRNKVIALGGAAGDFIEAGNSRTIVGQPLGRFYMRVTQGIFNTQQEINAHAVQDNNPRPGDRKFKDVNGDGVVNNNDLDFVGDPNPEFNFGISNTLSFKAFDLSITANGVSGNDIFYNYAVGANLNGNLNQDGVIRGRWMSPQNPGTGNIPRAIFGFGTLTDVASDFYMLDGSYLRISNITLGYAVPAKLAGKIGAGSARFFVSGQNLLTLTKYPGYDPELGAGGGNPLNNGVDAGLYPMSRLLSMGLNISF